MKTTAVVAALLASAAMAQPHHGRHVHQKKDLEKRKYETEWVTHTEWATLYIDEDSTTLQGPSPAQFYPSTTSEKTTSTMSSSESSSTDESTTTPEPTREHTSTPPEPTTTEAAPTKEDPTTSQAPAYTPTTSEVAEPTSGPVTGSYSGEITLYDLVGYGACGNNLVGMAPSGASSGDPAVVALAVNRFTAANPNNDPLCGKLIEITAGGVTGYGIIQDKCAACSYDDIDINPEAFAHFMPTSVGRSGVSWRFIS